MWQVDLARRSGRDTRRRPDGWASAAVAFTVGYAGLRLYWATGGRWGYTACDRSENGPGLASGCGADQLPALPFWSGWGAVGLCGVLAVVVAVRWWRRGRIVTAATWVASAVPATMSFPLHLLFEVPAGLAGRPTDWRDLGHRGVLLIGAALLAAAAATGPERRRRPGSSQPGEPGEPSKPVPVPVPVSLRRWVRAAVLVPVLGWSVPHGLWVLGVPFGIDANTLAGATQDISTPTGLAIAVVPGLAGLLALGLARRWGQVFPGSLPYLGGRPVPRLLVLLPAGLVALTLIFYGLLSTAIMAGDLLAGTLSRAELVEGWAVVATLPVFTGWGACLGMAALGYHRMTRPPDDPARDDPAPHDPGAG